MKKLSNIISKSVYKMNGQKLGYVLATEFSVDCSKLVSLVIVDEETEVQMKVDASEVVHGEEAIFLKTDPLFVDGYGFSSPIGKMVFDKLANFLGKVKEVYLNNNRVIGIATNKICFLPKNISVNGESALVLFGKKQKTKPFNFDDSILLPEQKVKITDEQSQIVPYRIELTGKSLIGKVAMRDIFGFNNELIIKKYEVITQKKINEAKKHNKLNLLFYNCK